MVTLKDIFDAEDRPEVERFRRMTMDEFDTFGSRVLASGNVREKFLWQQESRRRILNKTAFGIPEQTLEA